MSATQAECFPRWTTAPSQASIGHKLRRPRSHVIAKGPYLHQPIDEHRYSAIIKHLKKDQGLETIGELTNNFSVLKKCNGKLECLIYEMLFIKKKGHT